MEKQYVNVICDRSGNGRYIPLEVICGNRHLMVDRVVHSCRSVDGSFTGTRYTVIIRGKEKFLYRDGSIWYVGRSGGDAK